MVESAAAAGVRAVAGAGGSGGGVEVEVAAAGVENDNLVLRGSADGDCGMLCQRVVLPAVLPKPRGVQGSHVTSARCNVGVSVRRRVQCRCRRLTVGIIGATRAPGEDIIHIRHDRASLLSLPQLRRNTAIVLVLCDRELRQRSAGHRAERQDVGEEEGVGEHLGVLSAVQVPGAAVKGAYGICRSRNWEIE